ncbi:MAG: hypothetical protein LBB40_01730 [Holophagales bacterium]|nr:hypothetical protein [Holophagales bacterium]
MFSHSLKSSEEKSLSGTGSKRMAALGGILALVLAGCRSGNTDTNAVIAKIGAEKITEAQFHDLINVLAGDPEKAKEFLTEEKNRGQRNEFLTKYIESKGLVMLAKDEGLDGDPKIKLQLDEAIMQVYAQAILERRMTKAEPTEAELRVIYDEIAAKQRAMGMTLPPFEEAKTHLPALWKQKQQQEIGETLIKEIKAKYPITIADEYKAANN